MQDKYPLLCSVKILEPEFDFVKHIWINSEMFSVGRGLNNSAVIPYIAISRNHCQFKKINNDWVVEDCSTGGIILNGNKMGKGIVQKLSNQDILQLDPCGKFVYEFKNSPNEIFESPKKRIKLEDSVNDDIISNAKIKFEASQSYEIEHINNKIHNAKQMQDRNIKLKQQLQLDMSRRMKQLENEFQNQIQNLEGKEIEKKADLVKERNAQLAAIKQEMEAQIAELMEQIKRHKETELELLKENNSLKENMMRERDEFLAELNRENSSLQDILSKLESKMAEQEKVRQQERKELQERLHRETEQLRLSKEKELKQLEEEKTHRELELKQELNHIKTILESQVEQAEQLKLKAEEALQEQTEKMKKLNEEDKLKMNQLEQEKEKYQKQLDEAQKNAETSLAQLQLQVTERETELAALAADRIQKQAEQSSEVINTLQDQLEKLKNQLQSTEREKNTLIESICSNPPAPAGEGTSKETALAEVGELMENELQCSICAELFVSATTLNCSHTFCKFCINMWMKKKMECPNCRAPIKSECKSLALDSFIAKMVESLSDEMKRKRQELLQSRQAEVEATMRNQNTSRKTSRRSRGRGRNTNTTITATISTTSAASTRRTITLASRNSGRGTSTTQIPIVDLTMTPIAPSNPPVRPPVLPLPVTLFRPQTHQNRVTYLIQDRPQTVVLLEETLVEDGLTYRDDEGRTTAATDAATSAVQEVIGHPVVPSRRS